MEEWMRLALAEAKKAALLGELPIGAAIVKEGRLIAAAGNAREALHDPSAHAEILALRAAGRLLGDWRLDGCELYATLEPCAMCAAAVQQARLKRVVFGAFDEEKGACGSVYALPSDDRLGRPVEVVGGLLRGECEAPLRAFFAKSRAKNE
ncbi:MAG: nucleoside deaminase [Christensenellaceae bacterium]|jgi:tRNA(adenine34) deaminase|nr:nucleoside deaminase [Christensenellaceae bacterium]